jgi:hypothetical protein
MAGLSALSERPANMSRLTSKISAIFTTVSNPKGSNVLMFDPATASVMKIPADFKSFHNDEIVNYSNEALDAELFSAWLAQNNPLQCES